MPETERRSIRAVFFDLGGTLIEDREPDRWAEAARRAKIPVDTEALVHFEQEVRAEADQQDSHWNMPVYWGKILERATGAPVATSQVEEFLAHGLAVPAEVHVYADVRQCVRAVRRERKKLGVISNSISEENVSARLERAGFRKYFEVVVSSGTEGINKPDPAIFRRAADRIGVRPQEAVHVGDLLHTDAMGANAAGFAGVWLNRNGTGLGDYPYEISSLRELPREIRRIEQDGVK